MATRHATDKLSPKQQRFVDEYLVDLNATAAYKRAGYKARNDNVAGASAAKLLKTTKVAAVLAKAVDARAQRVGMTADDVLREIKKLGQSSVTHYKIDEFGELQLADGAPEDAWGAVKSIKKRIRTDENGNTIGIETEFQLWDKPGTLRMAGQHTGVLVDKVEHTVTVSLAELIEATQKPVAI